MSAAFSAKTKSETVEADLSLRVGGFVPLSTTDYPGRLSAVVFCQGCPWRCGYCHNPHLIPQAATPAYAWPDILEFLSRRPGLLDAVVFSGGEPTLQRGLGEAMSQVRTLGFKVGLHTAGAYPERLREVLPLCDWVGLDIKGPFEEYERVCGVPGGGERARASLDAVVESEVAHECRTTVHRALHELNDLHAVSSDLLLAGAECHVLQPFRAAGCRDAALLEADDALATAALVRCAASLSPGVLTRLA